MPAYLWSGRSPTRLPKKVRDHDIPGRKRIKGLTVGRAEHKMGQHASATNELIFEDCRIPKSAMMGKPNDGFRIAAGELAGGRIGIGSLGLGCGLAAMDYATKYAKERKQFDQSITNFQAIQWMIAESYTELEAARLLLMNAAYNKEKGRFFARQASMAKYYATEAAERACYNAIQMLGGYGYTKEFPWNVMPGTSVSLPFMKAQSDPEADYRQRHSQQSRIELTKIPFRLPL